MPRHLCWMAVSISVLVLSGERAYSAAGNEQRPNFLFIFTDDQPQSCLGCMGNEHIQTPNLDRLAKEGVLFTNAFVTTSICCSNRACILTGQYMRRHGIEDFVTPLSAEAFAQTYPALLRAAGYRTGFLGKFAIGSPAVESNNLSLPSHQFDYWFGFPQSINFRQKVDGDTRYLTTLIEEKAVEFLQTNTDKPFCLTVALKEPHGPWNYFDPDVADPYAGVHIPPPETFSRQDYDAQPNFLRSSLNGDSSKRWLANADAHQDYLRKFYGLITRVDLAVGRLRQALLDNGLADNTIVIFSSDHGSLLGAHGLGGKWIMYEESIRVPFIIHDPRGPTAERGRRCDKMVLSVDLAPTMLKLAGAPVPDGMQGRELTPLLRDDTNGWRTDWYYEHVYNTRPPRSPIVKVEGVRTEHWKYIRYPETEGQSEQLFDLEHDPLERENLVENAVHRPTLTQLRNRCDEYRERLR